MILLLTLSSAMLAKEAFIMDSIYEMESSRGRNCETRFEPGFLSRYGNSGNMPELRKKFGDKAAASSYGPYQTMLSTAYQYGFRGTPDQLKVPKTNAAIAWQIVHRHCVKTNYDEYAVFKRYNGGDAYAKKGVVLYNRWLSVKERHQ